MSKENFSVLEGVLVQSRHLSEWKQVLKSSVYKKLAKEVKKENHLATNGYGICRGLNIDTILDRHKRIKAFVSVVYPFEDRRDFYKFVVRSGDKILTDFKGEEMYFDSLDLAQKVCDTYNKVSRL